MMRSDLSGTNIQHGPKRRIPWRYRVPIGILLIETVALGALVAYGLSR